MFENDYNYRIGTPDGCKKAFFKKSLSQSNKIKVENQQDDYNSNLFHKYVDEDKEVEFMNIRHKSMQNIHKKFNRTDFTKINHCESIQQLESAGEPSSKWI